MSYTEIFYWLTVADNAKVFFATFAIFFTVLFIIIMGVRLFSDEDDMSDKEIFYSKCNKWTWYSTPLMLLFVSLWIFTPNKKDALLILAGGSVLEYMSNDSIAKEIPHNVFNFVNANLETWASEAKVDFGISSQKDKLLEKAKSMTADELIKLMKSDPDFKQIILNNN